MTIVQRFWYMELVKGFLYNSQLASLRVTTMRGNMRTQTNRQCLRTTAMEIRKTVWAVSNDKHLTSVSIIPLQHHPQKSSVHRKQIKLNKTGNARTILALRRVRVTTVAVVKQYYIF
jgi:hypothetical protein